MASMVSNVRGPLNLEIIHFLDLYLGLCLPPLIQIGFENSLQTQICTYGALLRQSEWNCNFHDFPLLMIPAH